ncbi:hypothetical protein H072_10053 [Dactylellina haptotyla CBS 200.50]|uniref:Probable methionine--tRNA ligase, mitochondrial n=1 Tax=Dactylellina haptotyla (strain CBS 200.50) TaxID=1284197 RepID=S8A146_DACHA|nr:hypothetical protein H072_10053 [Dactylellina haptotyla CBS 200.50]
MLLSRGVRIACPSWRCVIVKPTVVVARRFQSTSTVVDASTSSTSNVESKKPYYLTTPIFYVNAAPHIGHLYTSVVADVLKRWQQFKGNEALLLTGTDEYGIKIQQAASRAGVDPKAFVDVGADTFKKLAAAANISYDRFMRTTDPDHREAVQHFWRVLRERDFITLKKHSGWYSVSDEAFYPESSVERVVHPPSGQVITVSKETGKTVEWMSEENYHFKLSAMGPELLNFYEANPDWLVPSQRYGELKAEVARGLEDLSISRPKERLAWGIPVPGDNSQSIYVWLDALINYITFAGYPWLPGTTSSPGKPQAWPADLQIIGKDIIRFHCIYWPAFLLAVGAQPPKQILSHAHWTMSKKKMSKSDGNVVDPFHAMERWGVDTMRFYMCMDGGIISDGDYSNQEVEDKYTHFLGNQVGSLVNRVCSKKYSIAEAIRTERDGVQVELDEDMGKLYKALRYGALEGVRERVEGRMARYDLAGALREVMTLVSETHKYIHLAALWQENKEGVRAYMLYPAAEALRISGMLLQPFMPEKMGQLLDILKVGENMRGWEEAAVGRDFGYGEGTAGTKERLFPKVYSEEQTQQAEAAKTKKASSD